MTPSLHLASVIRVGSSNNESNQSNSLQSTYTPSERSSSYSSFSFPLFVHSLVWSWSVHETKTYIVFPCSGRSVALLTEADSCLDGSETALLFYSDHHTMTARRRTIPIVHPKLLLVSFWHHKSMTFTTTTTMICSFQLVLHRGSGVLVEAQLRDIHQTRVKVHMFCCPLTSSSTSSSSSSVVVTAATPRQKFRRRLAWQTRQMQCCTLGWPMMIPW